MKALVLCLALVGCGASARHKTLSATFATLDIAAAGLVKVDAEQETSIVTRAPDEASGEAALKKWRGKVDSAEKTIDTGYRAVAAAALADDSQSLATVLAIAGILRDELVQLGIKL